MAKYNVTYSCGHEQTVQLYGKTAERERKIEWYESSGLCSECYAEKKERDRREQAIRDADANQGTGFAPLTEGTEKQIAWAETIRRQKYREVSGKLFRRGIEPQQIAGLRVYCDQIENGETDLTGDAKEEAEEALGVCRAACDALEWLAEQQSAKFWIDGREFRPLEYLTNCPSLATLVFELEDNDHVAFAEAAVVCREILKARQEAEANAEAKHSRELKIAADGKRLLEVAGAGAVAKVWSRGDKKRVYLTLPDGSERVYNHFPSRYDTKGLGGSAWEELESLCESLCENWDSVTITG